MKKLLLIVVTLQISLHSYCQFPLHYILPIVVADVSYGDTLLNNSTVLRKNGISKVTTQEKRLDGKLKSSGSTEYQIINGRIISKKYCFQRTIDNEEKGFCTKDTLIYDDKERLIKIISGDGLGKPYMQILADYPTDKKIVYTITAKGMQQEKENRDKYFLLFNTRGQITRKEVIESSYDKINASLFYDADGMIDSIQHEDAIYGTMIFKKKQKGNNKEITLDTKASIFKWVYNSSGQCISSGWTGKDETSRKVTYHSVKVSYYYNQDGTLSKVVEKSGDRNRTIDYSYTK